MLLKITIIDHVIKQVQDQISLNDRQVVIGSAYHSTRIFPVFSNMSRTFAGSAPRGAALKLKSNMAEVKMGGQ